MQPTLKPQLYYPTRLFFCILLSIIFYANASAVELPSFFADHMVLQRNKPIRVWGWAQPGEKIAVVFDKQKAKAVTQIDGMWQVTLKPMPAGGPYGMKVMGKKTIELDDVWMGDVWFCSGQSNMEWPINALDLEPAQIKLLENNRVSVFTAPHAMASTVQNNLKEGAWKLCTTDNLGTFSAVATYFAHYLQPEIGVPIGMVVSAWGGTDIEAWMSPSALGKLDKHLSSLKKLAQVGNPIAYKEYTDRLQQHWNDSLETYDKGMTEKWFVPYTSIHAWDSIGLPAVWDVLGYKGEGVGWFKRTIELTGDQVANPVFISLGPVHNRATLFINGQKVNGPQKVGNLSLYPLPAGLLQAGVNHIAVKVYKFWSYGGFTGKPDDMFLSTSEGMVKLAGTWYFKPGYLGKNPMLYQGPNAYHGSLFNAMVHPFGQLSVKGVLWYQGENNVSRPKDYDWHLQTMILDWRKLWRDSTLPFLVVQLPNFKGPASSAGNYALIREAQHKATLLPHVHIAVTIDVGDSLDIHPANKAPVGYRLSLLARRYVYGQEQLVAEGPVFSNVSVREGELIIEFNSIGNGLTCTSPYEYLFGFEVGNRDGIFFPAPARIEGNHVIVSFPKTMVPQSVRYSWADNPVANLYNKEGLPAAPFLYYFIISAN